ncbi:MAG: DNA methylase, partial [Sphingobacteriales bacterium]
MTKHYEEILEMKKPKTSEVGFEVKHEWPHLYPFQKYCVRTALKKGRFALFEGCGDGKTRQQLTFAHEVVDHTERPVLILAPLAVVDQTIEEAIKIGYECIEYLQEMYTMQPLPATIYITNYEQLDNIPVEEFGGVVLDESSILKSFTGKTKRMLVEYFKDTPYKLACSGTPAPNDLNEYGNHSEFLNVLDAQDMRAKWFVRDEGMNNYRLKGHAKDSFYAWLRTWCIMFNKPAEIGYPMPGYDLPKVHYTDVVIKAAVRENGKLHNEGHI